jgi:hypothetical protein
MVREDLPDPDTPVTTTSLFLGISTSIFFRLCILAPLIKIGSRPPPLRFVFCFVRVSALLIPLKGKEEMRHSPQEGHFSGKTKQGNGGYRRGRWKQLPLEVRFAVRVFSIKFAKKFVTFIDTPIFACKF